MRRQLFALPVTCRSAWRSPATTYINGASVVGSLRRRPRSSEMTTRAPPPPHPRIARLRASRGAKHARPGAHVRAARLDRTRHAWRFRFRGTASRAKDPPTKCSWSPAGVRDSPSTTTSVVRRRTRHSGKAISTWITPVTRCDLATAALPRRGDDRASESARMLSQQTHGIRRRAEIYGVTPLLGDEHRRRDRSREAVSRCQSDEQPSGSGASIGQRGSLTKLQRFDCRSSAPR